MTDETLSLFSDQPPVPKAAREHVAGMLAYHMVGPRKLTPKQREQVEAIAEDALSRARDTLSRQG